MDYSADPAPHIEGRISVPGDKSISHRALLLGSLAEGHTEAVGFLSGEDCRATLNALEALGVDIELADDQGTVSIRGQGARGLRAARTALDLRNSGTAMRLLCGVLAAQPFDSELTGDESLRRRPMERVAEPLRRMGAQIETTDGHAPLRIFGGHELHGIDYAVPVASAQVKSALLLAGLNAAGTTRITEPAITRDHTERMLTHFGCSVARDGLRVSLNGGQVLTGRRVEVPGDLSSAAFPIVAACLAERGELVVDGVGLNPTRTGVLDILRLMNADIEVQPDDQVQDSVEPRGRIIARASRLRGTRVPPELVPLAIDEFPLLFVAAALAEGETVIAGAGELRHKESDRIAVMVAGLRALGADIDEQPDGAVIRGGGIQGGEIDSAGDHRVAMAFAVASAGATDTIRIRDTANVATSFPGFVALAEQIGLQIEECGDG